MTATEALRHFNELLDAVERGESVMIRRGNRPIAEIRPARRRTGRELRTALRRLPPLDDSLEGDIASALDHLSRDARARFGELPGVDADTV